MKIRVAILDQDQNYQNRLLVALRERFSRKLMVFPCNNKEDILGVIEAHEIKVFVINKMIDYDISQIPDECAVVYLTEMKTPGEIEGVHAICKYQKVADIVNQLFEIGSNYGKELEAKKEAERKAEEERLEAERKAKEEQKRLEAERLEAEKKAEEERLEAERKAEEERLEAERKAAEEEKARLEEQRKAEEEKLKERRSNPDIYAFVSAENGDGATTSSIACVINNLDENKNILYLDLKLSGATRRFFTSTDNKVKFQEVLTKAATGELNAEILNDSISRDVNLGVDFINNVDCTYELIMLSEDGLKNLFKSIGELVKYDIVIVNIDSNISKMNLDIFGLCKKVILVGCGSVYSNNKITNMIDVVRKHDNSLEENDAEKINILYNKFVNRNCTMLNLNGISVLGNIGMVKEKTEMKVIETMSKMAVFAQIIE